MGDNQQLLNLLSLPNVLLDPAKQQQAVNQLCRLMNTDCDEAQIVQPCIKLLSSHQPLTRIVVMQLVQRHVARNPDIMPQATNALLKCAVDPNPAVRRAAVSTLARVPDSGEVTGPVVAAALRDPHPAVQRAAAVACRVLPRSNPDCHIDHVDELYRLIRSDDALLVHACLTSLDVILAAEGGIVISRAMVRHLSSRSRSLPDFVLVDVLRLLARYQPTSDEERLTLMNRLDWTLASPAPHLVEAALELFFHLCSEGQLRHLRADAVRRAAAALCSPPAAQGAELRWAVLQLVSELGTEHHAAFSQHYRYFVPRPSDGPALSVQLVQFLWRLAVADTSDSAAAAPSVVRELSVCVSSPRLQTAAAESLLRVAAHRPELADATLEPLVRVVRSGQSSAAAVAGVLTPADLAPLPAAARRRLLETVMSADLTALPAQPLCRLLKAIGLFGSAIPTAAALLRRLVLGGGGDRICDAPGSDAVSYGGGGGSVLGSDAVSNDTGSGSVLYGDKGSNVGTNVGACGNAYSSDGGGGAALGDLSVRLALLEATARLFIHRPAELQLTLGLLLERAVAAGGELAATAARLYAALELSGGRDLMDGTEVDERETPEDGTHGKGQGEETMGIRETDNRGSHETAGRGSQESARTLTGTQGMGSGAQELAGSLS